MARIDPNTEDFIKRALMLKDGEPIPAKVEDEYMRAKYLLDKGSGGGASFTIPQVALILFAAGVDSRPNRRIRPEDIARQIEAEGAGEPVSEEVGEAL